MPLGSSTVDTWVTNNAASASGALTQARFEQELWRAVNEPRYKKKMQALELIQAGYPSLSATSVVAELRAEVTNVAYP